MKRREILISGRMHYNNWNFLTFMIQPLQIQTSTSKRKKINYSCTWNIVSFMTICFLAGKRFTIAAWKTNHFQNHCPQLWPPWAEFLSPQIILCPAKKCNFLYMWNSIFSAFLLILSIASVIRLSISEALMQHSLALLWFYNIQINSAAIRQELYGDKLIVSWTFSSNTESIKYLGRQWWARIVESVLSNK